MLRLLHGYRKGRRKDPELQKKAHRRRCNSPNAMGREATMRLRIQCVEAARILCQVDKPQYPQQHALLTGG